MKCELKQAKEYQKGFKSGLVFTGFEDGEIQWLGNNKEFKRLENRLVSNCCGASVDYRGNNVGLCLNCYEWCGLVEEDEYDEDDLLDDKLQMEYMDNMRDDLIDLGEI